MQGIQYQFNAYEDAVREANRTAYDAVESALDAAFASVAPYVNKTGQLGGVTPYSNVSIAARGKIQAAAYQLASALKQVTILT